MPERNGPVLITGGNGQLAVALEHTATEPCVRVGRPRFDFDKPDTIREAFEAVRPSIVVNAAAHTAVDAAETDSAAAWRANKDGPEALGHLCAASGIPLIHVSTDYVFDGTKGAPYEETDPVSPLGVYGASKLAGEEAVLASGAHAVILRTSWVYSEGGKNFVRTMLTVGKTRDRLTVVADQCGCPTSATDLANAIWAIIGRIRSDGWQPQFGGVFHAAGHGWTTWHGLAEAVFQAAATQGMTVPHVAPIRTEDWPTPAKRPADSRLDCGRLRQVFGVRLPDWQSSVQRTVASILASTPPG